MLENENFKTELAKRRAVHMHPLLKNIMVEMVNWFAANKRLATITATVSTIEEDNLIGRKSRTHREGRAFDLRTWDLPKELVEECVDVFEKTYGHLGAISFKTNEPNLIVWHDAGTGAHLHVQLSGLYKVDVPDDLD